MVGRRGIAGIAAAALTAAVAFGGTATAGPAGTKSSSPTAQNGRIVFASLRDGGDNDVFIMNADGSNPVNLTANNPGDDYDPVVTPDGKRIVFARDPGSPDSVNAHIYSMGIDGSNPVDLTPGNTASKINDDAPSISPEGKRIAFDSRRADGDGDIFVMNIDGANPVNLTPADTQFDSSPDWSPDGTRIYYSHDANPGPPFDTHIGAVNPDGSNLRDIIPGDAPSASPDGTKIAFSRNLSGDFHIFVANVDGSGVTDLMPTATLDSFEPAWSPDGTMLSFTRDVDPASLGFEDEIHVMNADGSGIHEIGAAPTAPDPTSYGSAWEYVYTCGGRQATIIGTNLSEKLAGTKGADTIVSLGGNDKVSGKGGADRICGGDGKDKLSGGAGNDKLYGQAGKDSLTGGKGKDKLAGGPGKDKQKQ
jgi:TolB protein